MNFTSCSLIAAAAHPETLIDAVAFPLVLLLPFNHESGGHCGGHSGQREEKTKEL